MKSSLEAFCPHINEQGDDPQTCLCCTETICILDNPRRQERAIRRFTLSQLPKTNPEKFKRMERNQSIREFFRAGMPVREIAKQHGLTPRSIEYILKGGNHNRKRGLVGRAE